MIQLYSSSKQFSHEMPQEWECRAKGVNVSLRLHPPGETSGSERTWPAKENAEASGTPFSSVTSSLPSTPPSYREPEM